MRVELGMKVRTADDKDVGTIDRLIVNPSSGDVSGVVVHQGTIIRHDVEVPIESIQQGPAGAARVIYTKDEFDDLPRFVEESYRPAPHDWLSPYGYPTSGLLWPASYPVAAAGPLPGPYGDTAGRTTSAEAGDLLTRGDATRAVVEEGDDVVSIDGEKVGEVHSVTVDAESGQTLRLVVRKGFLFTEDLELPGSLVESVADGEVRLNVPADQVEGAARGARRP